MSNTALEDISDKTIALVEKLRKEHRYDLAQEVLDIALASMALYRSVLDAVMPVKCPICTEIKTSQFDKEMIAQTGMCAGCDHLMADRIQGGDDL